MQSTRNILILSVGVLLTTHYSLLTPVVAEAAAPANFQELVNLLIHLLNLIAPILIAIAVLLYFWNVSQTIWGVGESADHMKKLRDTALWGLAILFVMVSLWGILAVLEETLVIDTGSSNSTSLFGN